jgi:ActR/RegA family two-component response regulator
LRLAEIFEVWQNLLSGIAMRLLIIEDDEKTANALAAGLEQSGFSASTAHTGEEGF